MATARKKFLAGQQILQSAGLRSLAPQATSCPGCGRTTSTFFQQMAAGFEACVRAQMPDWKVRFPGDEELMPAVMGCVVTGPGEAKQADIGISLPGTFGEPKAPVCGDGRLFTTLKGDSLVRDLLETLDRYVASRYAG